MTPTKSTTSLREFTVLMASLMSIVAISIDALLPALGLITRDLNIAEANHAQYLISYIFIGMAVGQLICGPLSDALGRKKILYAGIALYLVGSIISFFAPTLEWMLIGRLVQGLGVAGPYVSAVSIVRDKYAGRDMARVMSVVMMIFILVPAVAPTIGQLILTMAHWRYIFVLYIAYSLVIGAWLFFRLEETLPKENRIPFNIANLKHGFLEVLGNPVTRGYMICIGICFGSFIGYLNSSQQIFQVQFNTGSMFTVYFGGLALVLGAASLFNSRIVEKYGMAYICIRSIISVILASAIFLIINLTIDIQLWMFLIYAAIIFFAFGLMFGNLNALAMEPMGHIAGIASAIIGSVDSIISIILGSWIGQMYDNTLIPVTTGFMMLGILSLVIMVYTERSRRKIAVQPI